MTCIKELIAKADAELLTQMLDKAMQYRAVCRYLRGELERLRVENHYYERYSAQHVRDRVAERMNNV